MSAIIKKLDVIRKVAKERGWDANFSAILHRNSEAIIIARYGIGKYKQLSMGGSSCKKYDEYILEVLRTLAYDELKGTKIIFYSCHDAGKIYTINYKDTKLEYII